MAQTDTPPSAPAVKTELEHVKTQKDLGHAFEDINKLLSQKPDPKHPGSDPLKPLESANLKGLGLDGFKIVGYDKNFNGGGALLVSNDGNKTSHLIDSKGNEFAITGEKKDTLGNQEQATKLPTDTAQVGFGQNRKLEVTDPDGKSGKYTVTAKDNLWQISADLLGKNNKKLNQQDIKEIKDKINTIAHDNGIKDPNKILTGKQLNIAIPEAKQAEAKEALAKVAPDAPDQAAKDQVAKDQAAKDQAAKDQAAKDQAAKDQAAKDQAETDAAKLKASAFHPDTDTANLKPDANGVYNPLAPQGLVEDDKDLTSRDKGPTFTDPNTGEGTRSITGELYDRSWVLGSNSTFTANETYKDGALQTRDMTYTSGYGNMKFKADDGSIVSVPQVQSIKTERQPDGKYASTVTGTDKQTYTFTTDLTPTDPGAPAQ